MIRAVGETAIGALETATSLVSAAVVHPVMSFLGVLAAYGRLGVSTASDFVMCAITKEIGR